MVADIKQFWAGFECIPCDLVFDVRTNNDPMLEALCPKCKRTCKTLGTWSADALGYGGRGCPTSQPGYEDRAAVLLFFADEPLAELVKDEKTKRWLDDGVYEVGWTTWRFASKCEELNKIARIVTRHRAITTAMLREQVWAAKKAHGRVAAIVNMLAAKQRGPGLSPADKKMIEKLGEVAGLLEEARLSE